MRVTVTNKLNRIQSAGFHWIVRYSGFRLTYNGEKITEYRMPYVREKNSLRLKYEIGIPDDKISSFRRRNIELFRKIAIGIAEIEFDRMLAEQNEVEYKPFTLDWSKLQ